MRKQPIKGRNKPNGCSNGFNLCTVSRVSGRVVNNTDIETKRVEQKGEGNHGDGHVTMVTVTWSETKREGW